MITRFAPSPTGPLHLGHAYSALCAAALARAAGGTFLLRIEDIDSTRARPEWEAAIYEDLAWLGLHWPAPVLRQSDRLARYAAALDALWARGLLYTCTCTRRDIAAAASAPQEGAPLHGPDGVIYPGTCRPDDRMRHRKEPRPSGVALRLDMARAAAEVCTPGPAGSRALRFEETGQGPGGEHGEIVMTADALVTRIGDVVLSRRDFLGSYHLCVVLDDADQGVSDVVRGQDLFDATPIHVVLQRLLGLPVPRYHHHRLIRDAAGKRLAKRDKARAIASLRAEGLSPDDLRAMIGM